MSGRESGTPPLVGIVGWKKSGKTTLVVRLIEVFRSRGLRVSSIKHAHHAFQIDDGHSDSARHRHAGANQVAIVSHARWAIVTELQAAPEPDLADVVAHLQPCDLVIVEGYKATPIPKIELRRLEAYERRPLAPDDPMIFAIAADHPVGDAALPVLDLDDAAGIADCIAEHLELGSGTSDAG
jgi:molybdopterin-guanine dinucleotide biosynthesis protein B